MSNRAHPPYTRASPCPHLCVVNSVHPAPAQGLAAGLECVGPHSTVEFIQVDEEEGAWSRKGRVSIDPHPWWPLSPGAGDQNSLPGSRSSRHTILSTSSGGLMTFVLSAFFTALVTKSRSVNRKQYTSICGGEAIVTVNKRGILGLGASLCCFGVFKDLLAFYLFAQKRFFSLHVYVWVFACTYVFHVHVWCHGASYHVDVELNPGSACN